MFGPNVVVRWARVDDLDPDDPSGLTSRELERWAAFRQPLDRQQFVGARRLLLDTVGGRVGRPAGEITMQQHCDRCGRAHGRPTVTVGGRPGPHVSLAHAGGMAIVAVADHAVGVDLEPADDGDRRAWVRTEAILKATGHGLDVDPSLVVVSSPESPPRLEVWNGPGRTPSVAMADLDTAPGFVAAVARIGRSRLHVDVDQGAV